MHVLFVGMIAATVLLLGAASFCAALHGTRMEECAAEW